MQLEQPRRPVRRTDPAEEEALLGVLGRWLDHEVAPQVAQLEDDDVWPAEMVEQMRSFGLFGAVIDPAWGGLGLSASTYAKVVSRISEVWMSLTGIFNSHLMLAILVERFGSEDLKTRFLPRLCSGQLRGGLALTEPDCGTDLSAVRTRAVRDGDGYLVDGTKTWISNGLYGEVFAVLVRTDPAADPPRRGLSMFVMEKGPGFSASRKLPKLGYRGIDAAELVLSDFSVPAANLIGEEGQGFYQAVSGLELGRINVAARGVGIARRALDEALRYAQQRRTFGKPICEHQAIQLKLGEMATRAEAARLLTEAAAAAYDRGDRCDVEAGMAKYFASEAAMENATEAMRIHGGYGYSKEFPVERLYRDAPLLCIGEGTNEMQRIIIARQLVERHRIS